MQPPHNRNHNRKFTKSGELLPFAGNTILCHLPRQGPNSGPFNVLLDFYRNARSTAFGRKTAFLPPSSYHVTILDGVCDVHRSTEKWPQGIKSDLAFDECTAAIADRIKAASLPAAFEVRMSVAGRIDAELGNTFRMPLVPPNELHAKQIEELRLALASAMGIPVKKPYDFHITLGYLTQRLTDEEQKEAIQFLSTIRESMAALTEPMPLGFPEFCVFKDMFAFDRQFFIGD